MLDTLFYYTGAVVWTLIIVFYVAPVLPLFIVGIPLAVTVRIRKWWHQRHWNDFEDYCKDREEGTREAIVYQKIVHFETWLTDVAELYINIVSKIISPVDFVYKPVT